MTAPIPGIVIRQLRRLALSCRCEQLAIKIGRALAYVAPRIEQRQYDPCQAVIPIQEFPYIAIKYPTSSFGMMRPNVFIRPRIWLLSWVEMLRN